MQLIADTDVEQFRAEFAALLDEHLPPGSRPPSGRSPARTSQGGRAVGRPCSSTTAGYCGQPSRVRRPQRIGAAAVRAPRELSRRRISQLQPAGRRHRRPSILSFGTDEQKQRWAVPSCAGDDRTSVGMSRRRRFGPGLHQAVHDGDHFVINGQKVDLQGHDADVIPDLRADRPPTSPSTRASVSSWSPTGLPGPGASPFPTVCHRRPGLPTECSSPTSGCRRDLVGPLNGGGGWPTVGIEP